MLNKSKVSNTKDMSNSFFPFEFKNVSKSFVFGISKIVCLFVSKNQFIIRDNKSIDVYSQFPVNYLKQYFYEIRHIDITCSLDNMVSF